MDNREREPDVEGGIKIPACDVCGGRQVMIRGRYPGCEDRRVCPTCLAERMDIIRGYASEARPGQAKVAGVPTVPDPVTGDAE